VPIYIERAFAFQSFKFMLCLSFDASFGTELIPEVGTFGKPSSSASTDSRRQLEAYLEFNIQIASLSVARQYRLRNMTTVQRHISHSA